ncbi:hypothetical protein Scel_00240 [Streptomyces cellostaticus]|nr:hypothetical protein Scel_00240 [Streptomyces cellostaticus]
MPKRYGLAPSGGGIKAIGGERAQRDGGEQLRDRFPSHPCSSNRVVIGSVLGNALGTVAEQEPHLQLGLSHTSSAMTRGLGPSSARMLRGVSRRARDRTGVESTPFLKVTEERAAYGERTVLGGG